MPPKSSLLALPYELRQSVLQYALSQDGSVELQYPAWTGVAKFFHPLFQVCRSLRDEALRAFYEVNDFIWAIELENTTSKSNPALYPLEICREPHGEDKQEIEPARLELLALTSTPPAPPYASPDTIPLTPPLPWLYPDLLRHLRHLHVNTYLPQDLPSSTTASPSLQAEALRKRLVELVSSLDHGIRLSEFHVLVTAKRRSVSVPLTPAERTALEALAEMQVRGKVHVQTGYVVKAVAPSVLSLDLARRMKAK